MDSKIIYNEQAYLDEVCDCLRKDIENRTRNISCRENDISYICRYINENVYILDPAELAQNMQSIHNLEAMSEMDQITLYNLIHTLKKPYFAKITFRNKRRTNTLYIGLHGYRSNNVEYIIDWRAPISQLYYDADIGTASFEAHGKNITVELMDKQHIIISDGRVIDVYSDSALVSDAILRNVLSQSSNPFMHQLVETLQRNQNQIIRSISNRDLFISGPAGSGKTVVAMHRIAYMLYSNRSKKNFDILFIAPHDSFVKSAKNIIPELTGEQIEMVTIDSIFGLKAGTEVESRLDYYERYILADDEEKNNIQCRSSSSTLHKIRKALVETLTESIMLNPEVKKLLNIPAFWNVLYNENTKYSLVDLIQNYLTDIGVQTKKINLIISEITRFDLEEVLRKVVPDFGKKCNSGFKLYDDFYLLEYAKCIFRGVYSNPSISHVVIDEIQDVTYIQYFLITKMYHASKTLVGDTNQCVMPIDKDGFLCHIDKMTLDISYRSTQEIMRLANYFIDAKENKVFMRNGAFPLLMTYDDEKMLLDFIYCSVDNSKRAIILTATNKEALELEEKLDMCNAQGKENRISIPCAAFYSIRGMEYDQVFVMDSEVFHKQKRYMYVAITRALHEVYICIPKGCNDYLDLVNNNLVNVV